MSSANPGTNPGKSGVNPRVWLAIGAIAVIAIIAVVAVILAPKDSGKAAPSAAPAASEAPAAGAGAATGDAGAAAGDPSAAAEPTQEPATQQPAAEFTGKAPKSAQGSAIEIGPASAKVKVEVYYDYMCPYCGLLEKQHGEDLGKLSAEGKINLQYHPMSFLDRASNGKEYSTRAANAFATAADADPATAAKFSQALFDNQPAEGTDGLTDEKIAELAKAAGVADDVAASFASGTFKPWVQWATQADFASGITGTPTIKINGEQFQGNWQQGTALMDAINQAVSAG